MSKVDELLASLDEIDVAVNSLSHSMKQIKTDLKLSKSFSLHTIVDFHDIFRYLFPLRDIVYQQDPNQFFIEQFGIHCLFHQNLMKNVLIPPYAHELNQNIMRIRHDIDFINDPEYYSLSRFSDRVLSSKEVRSALDALDKQSGHTDSTIAKDSLSAAKSFIGSYVITEIKKQKIVAGLRDFDTLLNSNKVLMFSSLKEKLTALAAINFEQTETFKACYEKFTTFRPTLSRNNRTDALAAAYINSLNEHHASTGHIFLLVSSSKGWHQLNGKFTVTATVNNSSIKTSVYRDVNYFILLSYLESRGGNDTYANVEEIEELLATYRAKSLDFYRNILNNIHGKADINPALLDDLAQLHKKVESTISDLDQLAFADGRHSILVSRLEEKLERKADKGRPWDFYIEGLETVRENSDAFWELLNETLVQLADEATEFVALLTNIATKSLIEGSEDVLKLELLYEVQPIVPPGEEERSLFQKILGSLELGDKESVSIAAGLLDHFESKFKNDNYQMLRCRLLRRAGEYSDAHDIVSELLTRHEHHADLYFERSILRRREALLLRSANGGESKETIEKMVLQLQLARGDILKALDLNNTEAKYFRELAYVDWLLFDNSPVVVEKAKFILGAIDSSQKSVEFSDKKINKRLLAASLNDLAYYLCKRMESVNDYGDLQRAVNSIQKAIEICIESKFDVKDAYLETQAYVYLLQARRQPEQKFVLLSKALESVSQAIKLSPRNRMLMATLDRISHEMSLDAAEKT